MADTLRSFILDHLREFSTPERPIYLVGGAVRDWLLGRTVHDFDFVLPGETRRLAHEIARRLDGALYVLDEERQTTRVVLTQEKLVGGEPGERLVLDFAAFRAQDLEGDLRDRDFSINAIAVDVAHPDRLIDPTGGLADLREKRIRACSETSIPHDPVRVLRAVRQALAFQFRIDPGTLRQMRAGANLLPRVSNERLRDEIMKILDGSQVALGIRILDQIGALQYLFPEFTQLKGVEQSAPHIEDVWEHTLRVVQHLEQLLGALVGQYHEDNVADLTTGSAVLWLGRFRDRLAGHFKQVYVPERTLRSLIFFSALYHDIGKPATRELIEGGKTRFLEHAEWGENIINERGRNLVLSTHEVARCKAIVKNHMRVHFLAKTLLDEPQKKLSRRSIYRFFQAAGDAGVDICLLSLADTRGTYGVTLPQDVWRSELETCRYLLEGYWEKTEEVVSPSRLLTGDDLVQMYGLKPGKQIGRILSTIIEAQAAGEIANREEAIIFIQRWLDNTDIAESES